MYGCIRYREMADRKQSQIILSLLVGATLQLQALEEEPWFHPLGELHAKSALEGSIFSGVNNGYNPLDYHSNNVKVIFGLLAPFSDLWDAEVEMELERTSRNSFGFESGAFQLRRSLWSDIKGDLISFDLGTNIRFVPKTRVRDVETPYHDLWNFELVSALGKELTKDDEWYLRTFLSGALGQANRGYPWIKGNFDIKAKAFKSYMIGAFVRSYFGTGYYTLINVRKFDGYSMFQHQSVDIGASFSLLFKVYGTLTLSFTHRALAKSYPEDYNSFRLSYDVPFSF